MTPKEVLNDVVEVETLRGLLDYDPGTGVFRWRKTANTSWISGRRGGMTKAGHLAGGDNGCGYLRFRVAGRQVTAHRAAWAYVYGAWPQGYVDHINGVKSDNRIANLRIATRSQNNRNSAIRKDSASGIKGVQFRPGRGGWIARIRVDGRMRQIGSFKTAEEARKAYETQALLVASAHALHCRPA